ncbi:hypothetical protein ABW20_dc0105577 [Dactylellina cionopaga]|nr:hypothetical protein ABW20_dc0105577 [Dactylellina cionopaga]
MSEQPAPNLQEIFAAWDRGGSSPSLIDLLKDRPELVTPSSPNERLTALVPGCGRGYDVLLFASHGINAYGLELSASAIAEAQKNAEKTLPEASLLSGSYRFVNGDFFESDWLSSLEGNDGKQFDIVYDYTFLCALDPSQGLRPKWASRMAELVKPGGKLICLEFPLYKSFDLPGPPWPLRSEIYKELLENAGFVRELHVKPKRYLEAGQDSDMVSVWKKI